MKRNYIVIAALALVACSEYVTTELYEKAQELCASNGGLNAVKVSSLQSGEHAIQARCNNSAVIDYITTKKKF